MKLQEWLSPPRSVLTLFIGLMTVCALALGWLGRQVLVHDRAVEAQRRQERLESAADRVVASTERALAAAETGVTVAATGEVEVTPAGRIAYMPAQPEAAPAGAGTFAEAETLEFRRQNAEAAAAFARLAETGNAQVRAGALVRLGRVLRREKRWTEALNVYAALEKSGATPVAGMPAGLVAQAARCAVLQESGDTAGARREATAHWNELTSGRWKVTKATLETYLKELKLLAPEVALPAEWEDRMALAEAAEWGFGQPAASGRAGLVTSGGVVSVSWERQGGVWSAHLAGPRFWQTHWAKLEQEAAVALRITDSEGRAVHGNGTPRGQAAFRAAAMTGLPWSVTASARPEAASAPADSWTARRRLLIAGLLVFALLLGSGSFLIARAISRELAVARLQSDFVSAVSHEFRSPLTSIRQLTEMLARGRVAQEQHKERAYELMLRESDRLRRLVESLLDFGRMQARQYKFRSDSIDAAGWCSAVVDEFRQTVPDVHCSVELSQLADGASIRGDREALAGALWSLLDNAVKYSPGEKDVRVSAASSNGKVEVSVRDRGTGIAREDLKRVFHKFYRGENAKKSGTKGTGIGLAMVKEIVEAHGGTVRVQSEPGRGSEFTMVLPCHES